MKYTLIAGVNTTGGIGRKGSIPWNEPEDLLHFKRYTSGSYKVLVMGITTWKSLPPKTKLPNRYCMVLTSNAKTFTAENTKFQNVDFIENISSLQKILEGMESFLPGRELEVIIIGGASVYKQFLSYADKIVLSRIKNDSYCDTYFPEFNEEDFLFKSSIPISENVTVITYDNRKKPNVNASN